MRTATSSSVRANGCEIRFSRTRRGNNGKLAIPSDIADRLALIKIFVSIAARKAGFKLKGVRFVISPTLLTRPYQLRFHEALTSYCGMLQRSITDSARLFTDYQNITRLGHVTQTGHDGFRGVEINFGLKKGLVTFGYTLVDGVERTTIHPETILI